MHNCGQNGNCCSNGGSGCHCPMKNSKSVDITLSDQQTYTCRLLATITIDEIDYVALQHPTTNQQLFYRCDKMNDNVQLEVINDIELDIVARAFHSILIGSK